MDTAMPLTSEQQQVIIQIDEMVKSTMTAEGTNEDVVSIIMAKGYDYMPKVLEIIKSTTDDEMNKYTNIYDGFYRYMKFLEQLAQDIRDGVIQVP